MQTNNKMREALEKIDKIVWDKRRHTKEETAAHCIATDVLTAVHSASPESIGDSAKMREALEAYIALWDRGTMNDLDKLKRVIGKMRDALSAPPRNCDVGTGEEQTLRFHDFCESHRVPFDHIRGTICAGAKCPAYNDDANCFFKWAQLPYEEGGAK